MEASAAMELQSVSNGAGELPAELRMTTTRSVRLTGTGWLNIFAAAFFFLVGVVLGTSMINHFRQDRATQNQLQKEGIASTGQVTRKWTEGRSSVPHVGYTFQVDGTLYSGQSEIPKDIWRGLQEYGSIQIRYLPQNPSMNRPATWEVSVYRVLFALFLPAFISVFGLLIIRRLPLQRRLAMEGIGVRGSITECVGPSRSGFTLNYTFRNANNDEVEIGSCPSDRGRKVGDEVWVLFLPASPSRSEIYPFNVDLFRIVRGI